MEVLERASQVYMRLGIKSVTMDDLARELGMSKKTLYKFFSDKNDLVNQIIEAKLNFDCEVTCIINEQAENAIDSLRKISKIVTEHFKNINPTVFYDLKKHYPEAWNKVQNHKWNFVRNLVYKNILKGIEEGVFRPEVNANIISNIYVVSTDAMHDSEIFPWPEYKFENVLQAVIDFHIHGLASEKGRSYLNQISNNETN